MLNSLMSRKAIRPPRGLNYVGRGDFKKQGDHQLALLRRFIGLKPDDRVLDVGCGIGRTASALTSYLSREAAYDGFDVVQKGVDWCNKNIASRFPYFNFTYYPIANDLYNTENITATDFIFPYPDDYYDKVILFSVFTHMQKDEIRHYMTEIARVLKKGGMCLMTVFLYDEHNEQIIANQRSFSFPLEGDGVRWMSPVLKSANVAIRSDILVSFIESAGMQMIEIVSGYWQDGVERKEHVDFQDIVVVRKE